MNRMKKMRKMEEIEEMEGMKKSNNKKHRKDGQTRLMVDALDTDHSGKLSIDELQAFILQVSGKKLSEQEMRNTMNKFGIDGEITFEGFNNMLKMHSNNPLDSGCKVM